MATGEELNERTVQALESIGEALARIGDGLGEVRDLLDLWHEQSTGSPLMRRLPDGTDPLPDGLSRFIGRRGPVPRASDGA